MLLYWLFAHLVRLLYLRGRARGREALDQVRLVNLVQHLLETSDRQLAHRLDPRRPLSLLWEEQALHPGLPWEGLLRGRGAVAEGLHRVEATGQASDPGVQEAEDGKAGQQIKHKRERRHRVHAVQLLIIKEYILGRY